MSFFVSGSKTSWCLKSPETRLFVYKLVKVSDKGSSVILSPGQHLPATDRFPSYRTSNMKNVSMAWRPYFRAPYLWLHLYVINRRQSTHFELLLRDIPELQRISYLITILDWMVCRFITFVKSEIKKIFNTLSVNPAYMWESKLPIPMPADLSLSNGPSPDTITIFLGEFSYFSTYQMSLSKVSTTSRISSSVYS